MLWQIVNTPSFWIASLSIPFALIFAPLFSTAMSSGHSHILEEEPFSKETLLLTNKKCNWFLFQFYIYHRHQVITQPWDKQTKMQENKSLLFRWTLNYLGMFWEPTKSLSCRAQYAMPRACTQLLLGTNVRSSVARGCKGALQGGVRYSCPVQSQLLPAGSETSVHPTTYTKTSTSHMVPLFRCV